MGRLRRASPDGGEGRAVLPHCGVACPRSRPDGRPGACTATRRAARRVRSVTHHAPRAAPPSPGARRQAIDVVRGAFLTSGVLMSLRLIIEDDEGSTTIVPLGKDAVTIGRQQ